jgi:hypothetical protein
MLLPGTGRGTARRRRVVEGAPPLTSVDDSEDHPLVIVVHLHRWDTHGQETQVLEMSVPNRIARRAVATVVPLAIDLDCQACRQTCKIE